MNEVTATTTSTSAGDPLLNGLMGIGQLIEQRMDEAVQVHGLSLAKMGALHNLVQRSEPVPLGVLSRELHCVKSNITQLIDRLEADKLARRVPDPEDRRSVRAEITEEGRKRFQAGRQALEEVQQEILGGLSGSEREQLLRLLARMRGGDGL